MRIFNTDGINELPEPDGRLKPWQLVLGSLIIIFIVVAAVLFYLGQNSHTIKSLFNNSGDKTHTNKDSGQTNKASDYDFTACLQKSDIHKKDYCFKDLAKSKKDQSICGQIKTRNPLNWCYYDVALAKEDVFVCDLIQDEAINTGCYYALAQKSQSREICDWLKKSEEKTHCLLLLLKKEDQNLNKTEERKIKQKIFEGNIFKILIFYIVGLAISALLVSGILHWVLRKLNYGTGEYSVTLKISLTVAGIITGVRFIGMMSGLYLPPLNEFFKFLDFFSFFIALILYHVFLKKWHNTTSVENIKILLLMLLILFVIVLLFGFISYGLYFLLLMLSVSRGGGFI